MNLRVKRHRKSKSDRKYRGISKIKYGSNRTSAIQYAAVCRNKGKRVYIGQSNVEKEAAMMYNVYTIKNNIVDNIVNEINGLNTIDNQIKYLESRGFYLTEDYRFKKKLK